MEICRSINAASPHPLEQALLSRSVKKWWPDLDDELKAASKSVPSAKGTRGRSDREILEEVLNAVRSLVRPPSAPVGRDKIPLDHPLVGENRQILDQNGYSDCRIMYGTGRRLGLTGVDDPDLRDDIIRRAGVFGITVEFLPPRRLFRSHVRDGDELARVVEGGPDPEPLDLN